MFVGLLVTAVALADEPAVALADEPVRVLVTGATGRTGSQLYAQLAHTGIERRAFVRSAEKARKVLGCTKCDESEGIYVGEVTDTAALVRASRGVSTVAIAVGVDGNATAKVQKAVEFGGVEQTLAALGQPANVARFGLPALRVVLCSSMGTTLPAPGKEKGGGILFWKLQAEAYLGATGIGSTVVKPCGLVDGVAANATLLVGHDDTLLSTVPPLVSRADVAAVMAAAVLERASALRFDLCSKPGQAQSARAVLGMALWPWQKAPRGF